GIKLVNFYPNTDTFTLFASEFAAVCIEKIRKFENERANHGVPGSSNNTCLGYITKIIYRSFLSINTIIEKEILDKKARHNQYFLWQQQHKLIEDLNNEYNNKYSIASLSDKEVDLKDSRREICLYILTLFYCGPDLRRHAQYW
ncbi:hypothetical protein ACJX0J_020940, partial [Zea mays]